MKNIFQNKIKQIKKNANLLQNTLTHVKKRKRLFEKGLKKIAKIQTLSQNEFLIKSQKCVVNHEMNLRESIMIIIL